MNDLKNTQTADLIAEWVRWDETRVWQYVTSQDEFPETMDALASIAAELDRRATEAGIHLTDHGYFRYEFYEFDYIGYGKHTNKMACLRGEISAKEQHDLEGWLLLKEGGKG